MDAHEATGHLEVIRTLMERAALYRRALAPVTLLTGVLGCLAGVVGWGAGLESPRGFGLYWIGIAGVGLLMALVWVRRQALKEGEPFWSPPTRRVVQAVVPPLLAGGVAGLLVVAPEWREPLEAWWLPAIWMVFYGCAVHAAGFFMSRGIRWFGWVYLVAGLICLWVLNDRSYGSGMPSLRHAHWLMAGAFGGFHLAYGIYLHFTESRRDVT